jgi:enamidase
MIPYHNYEGWELAEQSLICLPHSRLRLPLQAGRTADIVLIDAPDGGTQTEALSPIRHGDSAAIGAVVKAGVPRFVGRSRNTPATTRRARVARSNVVQDFSGDGH